MKDATAYCILALAFVGVSAPAAMAEILVAPTRVVLEKGERSTELVLVNKGEEPAAYRISLENRRMLLDGSMEDAVEAVLDQGLRTPDIKQDGDDCKLVGCVEMGEAVAATIASMEAVTV